MLPAGLAAILVVAGTVVVRNSASASPIDTYRTTTVTTGSVEQRLNLTGSAQRVNQVNQGFAVTGTVSSVSVAVGDTVTAGEVLATLNPTPLHSAVISATASLAKAKATLESDQSATTTAATTTSGTSGPSGTSGTSLAMTTTPVSKPAATAAPTTSPRVAGPSGRKGAGTSLAQAQQRVTSAQQAITADLRQASAALAQCAPFFPSESPTSSASPTPSAPSTTVSASSAATTSTPTATSIATPTPTSTTTASTSTPSVAEIKACLSALRTAPTQQQIQRHRLALTDSQSALMTTVTLAITTATNTANTPNTTSPSTSTGQSSTRQSAASGSSGSQASGSQASGSQASGSQASRSQSSGSQSSGSQAAQSSGGLSSGTGQSSASRAVTDQAAVTNAEAALSSAQADLTSATLKSSIGGTVGSVSLVKGASSQGKSVVIVGTGAVEVTVNVPLASIGTVHIGQKANVTPQGATSTAAGSVTSISLLPSTSTSSTGTGSGTGQGTSTSSSPTYPVVVRVPDALPALATGSRADVSLLIGTVSKALTVPNSALTPLAKGQAMAQTLKNGVVTPALVKTGYAGTLTTQITSGLSAGQQVVLADLSTALPTNTTSSRRLGFPGGSAGGLGGGLGGAGFGGVPPVGGTGFPPPG
jgi:trimeric autotransporter adhesin